MPYLKYKKKHPDKSIRLDIFGAFQDEDIKQKVLKIVSNNKNIKYCGVLFGDNVIRTISQYYCMLFPTFYPGEGTPHTVVESFMAGLPIIASNWKYNSYIISHSNTGLIFDLNEHEGLINSIDYSIRNKNEFIKMRYACFDEAQNYSPQSALTCLIDNLQSE